MTSFKHLDQKVWFVLGSGVFAAAYLFFDNEVIHQFFQNCLPSASLWAPFFILGGGGGGGGGGAEVSISVQSTSVTLSVNGVAVATGVMGVNGTFSCDNGYSFSGIGPNGTVSTPFLRVWDGRKFVLENDFLFGKPNTCFINKEVGEGQYKSGAIGGDTYVLQTDPVGSDGLLKMQIREIEPEESFIDRLSLLSIDLSPEEHLVANGSLKEFHIFDRDKSRTVSEREVYLSRAGTTTLDPVKLAYDSLGNGRGRGLVLHTGDEMILRVPVAQVNHAEDLFILIDSHHRDWSLGGAVPFTKLEKLNMRVRSMTRSSFNFAAGMAVLVGGLLGFFTRESGPIPYTYADVPHDPGTPGGCVGPNCWPGSRSLVVSVNDGQSSTYLETIFPRYAQASQEVVRIPRDFLSSLKGAFFTVSIRATKKHKVRAAFVFNSTPLEKVANPLRLASAFHRRLQVEIGDRLIKQDGRFTETIPGDVIDLAWRSDRPVAAGQTRRFILKADGFYTSLSESTKKLIGPDWYSRLERTDRKILRSFKNQQAV